MRDIDNYQAEQEALFKILELGQQQFAESKWRDADSFFAEMDKERFQELGFPKDWPVSVPGW